MSPTVPARRGLENDDPGGAARPWLPLWIGLACVGTIARLLPFTDPHGRMLRQFSTEDGYLMLTIARNMALGRGMTTAEGTIPTNGTQPFGTWLYSLGFRMVDADRVAGVAVALALQLLAAIACAWVVYRLARRALRGVEGRAAMAGLAALAWFASTGAAAHGMNCLETGFYALAVAGFGWAFVASHPAGGGEAGMRAALLLGLLAGLVLWVRIDAVFLLAGACLVWAFLDAGARPRWSPARFREAVVLGAVAVAAISPWLLHNRASFGSFVPISGRAEAYGVALGSNLIQLPASLSEVLLLVVPVPSALEQHPLVVAAGAIISLAGIGILARSFRKFPPAARILTALGGVFALGLCGYYGVCFGVPHFLARYLFPLSVLSAIAWSAAVVAVAGRWRGVVVRVALPVVLLVLLAGLHARLYRRGMDHMHFQVVDWVEANVPDAVWIGAVQTGTVGYFHDRTINLDGKVNPEALAAVEARRIPSYVLEKPIRYLADWEGLASWADLPELRGRFELRVHDPERNLAVLERVD